IREDYLHQNAYHEIDTYTSLEKQHYMMTAILSFYDKAAAALSEGGDIEKIVSMPAREKIGRLKYAHEDSVAEEFSKCMAMLDEELAATKINEE
ncbi:MAG: V-type ATP synthase subunit A, partial [Oscillospiraceae bacterium]